MINSDKKKYRQSKIKGDKRSIEKNPESNLNRLLKY